MRLDSSKAIERRPLKRQSIEGIAKVLGGMTTQTRSRIMEEALRHVGNCGEFEISRLVAKNIGVQERIVDAVVMAAYLEERSRRAALETGIRSAVEMSCEAGRQVWAEIGGAY